MLISFPSSRQRLAALVMLAPLLACTGGCSLGSCGTHDYLLPLVLAIPGVAPIAQAIDDHSLGLSNVDFVLAGQLVDEHGQPLDSVEVEITAWVATHRSEGWADRWTLRTERHTLAAQFRLTIRQAQTLDIILRRPGYADQHVVFIYDGTLPPFVHIRPRTYRHWDDRENGPSIDSADLEDGGTYYRGHQAVRPVQKEDFRIVMERRAPASSDGE